MPLTALFSGECSADPGALIPIDTLRRCCNPGYARTMCRRAAAVEPDSAQFLVKSDRDGRIEVAWAVEKDHHPVAVGTLHVTAAGPLPGETLEVQARAIAANYARQRGRA